MPSKPDISRDEQEQKPTSNHTYTHTNVTDMSMHEVAARVRRAAIEQQGESAPAATVDEIDEPGCQAGEERHSGNHTHHHTMQHGTTHRSASSNSLSLSLYQSDNSCSVL